MILQFANPMSYYIFMTELGETGGLRYLGADEDEPVAAVC